MVNNCFIVMNLNSKKNSRAGYRDKFCVLYSLCLLAARSADADQSEAFLKNVSVLIGLEIECCVSD